MSTVQELLDANERYAAAFDKSDLPLRPGRQVAILTCMDARLDPAKVLDLREGDAHVIRNAGGRASEDALRSLIISSMLLGTREVLVIHHTDCGMLTVTNEALREQIRAELNADASKMDFLPFSDLDESVRDDMRRIGTSGLVSPDLVLSGFVYDVRTGRLRAIT